MVPPLLIRPSEQDLLLESESSAFDGRYSVAGLLSRKSMF